MGKPRHKRGCISNIRCSMAFGNRTKSNIEFAGSLIIEQSNQSNRMELVPNQICYESVIERFRYIATILMWFRLVRLIERSVVWSDQYLALSFPGPLVPLGRLGLCSRKLQRQMTFEQRPVYWSYKRSATTVSAVSLCVIVPLLSSSWRIMESLLLLVALLTLCLTPTGKFASKYLNLRIKLKTNILFAMMKGKI